MKEWIKHAFIRTPLEGPLKAARKTLEFRTLLRSPELYEIVVEEFRLNRFLRGAIRPTWNCVDVGCHLGSILSLIVAKAPRGQHVAYEPNPAQFAWLGRKFPEVDLRRKAASDHAGEMDFHIQVDRSGFSGLRKLDDVPGPVESMRVDVVTLDADLPPGRRYDFFKVVAEGAELSVLRGASEILRRDRPLILIECVAPNLAAYGDSPAAVFDFLTRDHSYAIYLLKDRLAGRPPLDLDRFEQAQRYPFQAFRFVAAPLADDSPGTTPTPS